MFAELRLCIALYSPLANPRKHQAVRKFAATTQVDYPNGSTQTVVLKGRLDDMYNCARVRFQASILH
jgi:hypothetical protein